MLARSTTADGTEGGKGRLTNRLTLRSTSARSKASAERQRGILQVFSQVTHRCIGMIRHGAGEHFVDCDSQRVNVGTCVLAPAQKAASFTGLEGATERKSSLSGTLKRLREVQVKFPDTSSSAGPDQISTHTDTLQRRQPEGPP